MGLGPPPVDEGGDQGTINVWEASIDSSSQAKKPSSGQVGGVAVIPVQRSVSAGTQVEQPLLERHVVNTSETIFQITH
jgi:hypothetical protein